MSKQVRITYYFACANITHTHTHMRNYDTHSPRPNCLAANPLNDSRLGSSLRRASRRATSNEHANALRYFKQVQSMHRAGRANCDSQAKYYNSIWNWQCVVDSIFMAGKMIYRSSYIEIRCTHALIGSYIGRHNIHNVYD